MVYPTVDELFNKLVDYYVQRLTSAREAGETLDPKELDAINRFLEKNKVTDLPNASAIADPAVLASYKRAKEQRVA